MAPSGLLLAVNGQKHEVPDPDPTVTLADFLRSNGATGVKIGCGEGGCGACTVVVAEWDTAASKPSYRSVNACLVPLCSCDGMAVTTTEGLRCNGKFHPLQESLAQHNGSQCGFCSPGMVMSMFGKLIASPGPNCPDAAQIEHALDGNLCRCTGYRSILASFRKFAGTPKDDVAGEKFAPFPDFLKEHAALPSLGPFCGSGKKWVTPTSVDELYAALADAQNTPEAKVTMIAGHTSRGIYKDDHGIDVFVDLKRIPDFKMVEATDTGIKFGSGVILSKFLQTLEAHVDEKKPEMAALPVLIEHGNRISGHGIRNTGTVGGNLMMTKIKGFQSDLATMLTGVGASATILMAPGKTEEIPLDTLYSAAYKLPENAVLKEVFVPFLKEGEVFRSFKTAVRPQNSHALLNAAFLFKVGGGKIEGARIVYGALGSRGDAPGPSEPEQHKGGAPGGPLRAMLVEKAVQGLTFEKAAEVGLAELEKEPWWPEDEFERHLAFSFLYKMCVVLHGPGEDAPFLHVAQTSDRGSTTGTQKLDWAAPELAPIAKPSPKLNAELQAAGDVRYTADIREPKDCLHLAYVQVPRVKAVLKDWKLDEAMKMPGFVGVVTSEDIPGENASEGLLPLFMQVNLLLPKGEAAQYAGQPCLAIVADTTRHAEMAAKKVELVLENPTEKAKMTVEACAGLNEAGEVPEDPPAAQLQDHTTRGDAAAGMNEAPKKVSGEIFCNSQKHFYMEPLSALVMPGEDSTLSIWTTLQVPSWGHGCFKRVTGLAKNKIVVNIPCLGGGFGGKLFRCMHVASTASVAAMKFKRAMRFTLNRNVDIVLTGGRIAMKVKYEAGFDDTGKLSAVKVLNLGDSGHADPCTGFASKVANVNMEQIYAIPNLDLKIYSCVTDKTPTTAVRGPGEPQASFIMESIIEHVAMELGKSPHEVREVNIFTDLAAREKVAADPCSPDIQQYSGQVKIGKAASGEEFKNYAGVGIWEMLKKNADYAAKAEAVATFNAAHTWKKRGLSMTPVRYAVSTRAQQVLICLYDDGTALITCDGTEIGQGLNTKVIQFAAYHLSQIVPGCEVTVDKIRVGPNGTDKVAAGSITGGSTTTEGCCVAVQNAIAKLKENLSPVIEEMKAAGKELTFEKLVAAASGVGDGREMQASGRCDVKEGYFIFGAAISVVEVDVLTGETTIISTDLLYDCGKSLNPIIDCGQCEGAFMMGVGFFLRENFIQNEETGQVFTDGTWEYKIPCAQDVPLEFNVEFFPRPFSEGGIVSSKASGEPPLVLATSVFCALRHAIAAARKDFGKEGHFRLDAPATPRDIALCIGASPEYMKV